MQTRDKLILAGLYLSKYDDLGLKALGFESFMEAFNVIGFALGSKPASIKNYRDEFDPLFPNHRKGWHKRKTREYCLVMFDRYRDLDFESFTGLVRSFFCYDANAENTDEIVDSTADSPSGFAQRLITGLAAERYFEAVQPKLDTFSAFRLENTSRLGCGYDFRLWSQVVPKDFIAVEVKGLREESGGISMTPKEHRVATEMQDRFYLFVVRNFREHPHHDIFQNPLNGSIRFKRLERVTIQISWLADL
jgi:hypothetical protein